MATRDAMVAMAVAVALTYGWMPICWAIGKVMGWC